MFNEGFDLNEIYDAVFLEIEPVVIREIVLEILKDLKKGLRQLVTLSPRSIEYRLLLLDIQKKIEEAKLILSAIVGEKEELDTLNEGYLSTITSNNRYNLSELIRMVEVIEKKLYNDDIMEAIAFFLALYEEMTTNFCQDCIFDAS